MSNAARPSYEVCYLTFVHLLIPAHVILNIHIGTGLEQMFGQFQGPVLHSTMQGRKAFLEIKY